MRTKVFFITMVLGILLLSFISADTWGTWVRPLSGGNIQVNTSFAYYYVFSSDSSCSPILYQTETQNVETDNSGVAFLSFQLPSNLTNTQYICEYKNSSLRAALPVGIHFANNSFVQNISSPGNISASWFLGNINASDVINAPFLWLNTTNVTYNAYNTTGLIRDWNISGWIINWNASGFIRDWTFSETDPKAYNGTLAYNTTLTDMWSSFLNTTNLSYLMIDRFNVTNESYLKDYGDTVTGNYTFDAGTLFVDSTNNRIGIGTTSPTNILSLSNAQAQKIWIENAVSSDTGKALTIAAGGVGTFVSDGVFVPLNQTSRTWIGMGTDFYGATGDVYACDRNSGLYKQTGGTGNFTITGFGVGCEYAAVAPNGDVYVTNYSGIYMQTNGTGSFVTLGEPVRNWEGIAATATGNVYAAVYSGNIYMQTAGTGNFSSVSGNGAWIGLTVAPNGDVYATQEGGGIFMQTNGTGSFNSLSQTARAWEGVAAAPNGDVYAVVYGGDVYKQTAGSGDFNALGITTRNYGGTTVASNGNVYLSANTNDIYMMTNTAPSDLTGGNLILSSGIGSGAGASSISFKTGTTLASGSTQQTLSEKMTLLGSGNLGIGTTTPSDALTVVGNVNISGCYELVNGTIFGGTCVSDISSKTDIQNLSINSNALLGISPITFRYNETINLGNVTEQKILYLPKGEQYGFSAQEVQLYYPERVTDLGNGVLGVNYDLRWMIDLWKQNQEQQKEINLLKTELCLKDNTYAWCK